MTATSYQPIHTKEQLIDAVTATGSLYFSPNTMRFFSSRVCAVVANMPNGDVVFVTSERRSWGSSPQPRRLYSVRIWHRGSKSIDSIGEFQGHATRSQAIGAANRYVRANLAAAQAQVIA